MMEPEIYLSKIEKETGYHVENIRFFTVDSRKPKAFQRQMPIITFQNGAVYSVKRLYMSEARASVFLSICEMKLPWFQNVPYIINTERTEYIVLSEWIEGSIVEDMVYARTANTSLIRATASALRAVHNDTLTTTECKVTQNNLDRVIRSANLNRRTEETVSAYMSEVLSTINSRCCSVTHGDMHIGNMVSGDRGQIRFIDLDDVSFGDPFEDLVYASNIIIDRRLSGFYYAFIQEYFGGNPPEDFWPIVNFYSILKIMAIRKHELQMTGGKSLISLDGFIDSHDGLRNHEAAWYRRMCKKYGD